MFACLLVVPSPGKSFHLHAPSPSSLEVAPPAIMVDPEASNGCPVVSWAPVPNATRYMVLVSPLPATGDSNITLITCSTSFVIDFLDNGQYSVFVIAANDYHASDPSNTVTVTVQRPSLLPAILLGIAGGCALAIAAGTSARRKKVPAARKSLHAAKQQDGKVYSKVIPQWSPTVPGAKASRGNAIDTDAKGALYLQKDEIIGNYFEFLDTIQRAWILTGDDCELVYSATTRGEEDIDVELQQYLVIREELLKLGIMKHRSNASTESFDFPCDSEQGHGLFRVFAREGLALVLHCSRPVRIERFTRFCIDHFVKATSSSAGAGRSAIAVRDAIEEKLHEHVPYWPSDEYLFPEGITSAIGSKVILPADDEQARDLIAIARSFASVQREVEAP